MVVMFCIFSSGKCIYSGGETGYNEILPFKLNLTLKVKVNNLQKNRDLNTSMPRQNGRHFPYDIFKWILVNEDACISIKMSLKFVPMGRINNIPALVQTTTLSEPMMVCLLTHLCVTRPQWGNQGILHPWYKFGWIGDELWCGQAQNGVRSRSITL